MSEIGEHLFHSLLYVLDGKTIVELKVGIRKEGRLLWVTVLCRM